MVRYKCRPESCTGKIIWAELPGLPKKMRWPVQVVDLPLVFCNAESSWYILCKVVYADARRHLGLTEGDVYNAVKKEIETMHGDFAIASLYNTPSLRVGYLDDRLGIVLIKCQRAFLKVVQSSISFVKKIGPEDAFFQTIHVGGTIRSSLKFLIKYHKSQLPKLLAECNTAEEKKQVQASIVKSCQNSTEKLSIFDKPKKRDKSETPRP